MLLLQSPYLPPSFSSNLFAQVDVLDPSSMFVTEVEKAHDWHNSTVFGILSLLMFVGIIGLFISKL